MFVTLEDETGSANVVLWGTTVERDRQYLLQAQMIVEGHVQKQSEVIHVVADRLLPWEMVAAPLEVSSSRSGHTHKRHS